MHRRHLDGAESQIRTGDRTIFSRVLYQLSYLGPPLRSEDYTTSRPIGTNTLLAASQRLVSVAISSSSAGSDRPPRTLE